MKMFFAIVCALGVAGSAFADVYNMAIQQARNVANHQSAPPAETHPALPPPQNNPPANPELEATLQNIANLRADFENLGSNPTNTQPLTNDLIAAAQGAKPSSADVDKLAHDLAAAIAGNNNLRAQEPKLAQYVHAIFNSSHLSSAQRQMIFDGVQKMLQAGGVSADEVTKVIDDLKTIASATK